MVSLRHGCHVNLVTAILQIYPTLVRRPHLIEDHLLLWGVLFPTLVSEYLPTVHRLVILVSSTRRARRWSRITAAFRRLGLIVLGRWLW